MGASGLAYRETATGSAAADARPRLAAITLDDKYALDGGRVYLTGVQALVRLMIEQARRDAAAGLATAGFVSGYRGSPLGGLDRALWEARGHLDANRVRFQPAVNEELAATAIIGTQQATLYPDATVDGVFALWYGKGPGLDRAGDALKHANSLGAAPKGGVLVVVGDDHGAVSSSMAHQCEQVMASWMMPVLHPATIQEYLDFGLLGFAMSRFSGAWVGFKAVSETVETATAICVGPQRGRAVLPADFAAPPDGLHIRFPDPQLAQEARLVNARLPAVHAFARANPIDRLVLDAPRARVGIATTGKAYLYLRQALADLGIDEAAAAAAGLRIYKVGLSWPLEPEGARRFAHGLETVLVIEEKRSLIEAQLKEILYNLPDGARPRVIGKSDARGAPFFPSTGELDPAIVARLLAEAVPELVAGRDAARRHLEFLAGQQARAGAPVAVRPPFFCAGCPHNSSTRVPDGSSALAGTGCHLMVMGMERNTSSILHMGAEGTNWIGMAPFVERKHIFQNLGDGTYVHSGAMNIRQAVAASATMTYKILYNDAVAMTGGQPPEGQPGVAEITRQVRAEGVRHIAVVSNRPGRFRGAELAPGTEVHHRDRLDEVQRRFRELPGVSVIVYDQACATELRRRRNRGEVAEPPERIFINTAVCEGCGDCSVQSNCVAVVPVETPFGRKRMIDQSSCNKDYSCLKGFCPALVSLDGATPRRRAGAAGDPLAGLPEPDLPALDRPYRVVIAGVGGTGVVTLGQILAFAAFIEGRGVSALDFTGLAQKGGGVLTHLAVAPGPDSELPARVPAGAADLLIASDMVVAAGPEAMRTYRRGRTRAVVNASLMPTAGSVLNRDFAVDREALRAALEEAVGPDAARFAQASTLAEKLTGDAITANMFLLGYAYQLGHVPVSAEAIGRAIELNGVRVDDNRRAFAWGRRAAHGPAAVEQVAGSLDPAPRQEGLAATIERCASHLAAYQDAAYADRYRALVERVRTREAALGTGGDGLARAVAVSLHRLMAYKDEYEVARLYTEGGFLDEIAEAFEGRVVPRLHLAPPLLGRGADGRRKRAFGARVFPVLRVLARLRRLRGTPFDMFGWQAERRLERRLIDEYGADVEEIVRDLTPANHAAAVELAGVPQTIRGFGPVKLAAVDAAAARRQDALAAFRGGAARLAAE